MTYASPATVKMAQHAAPEQWYEVLVDNWGETIRKGDIICLGAGWYDFAWAEACMGAIRRIGPATVKAKRVASPQRVIG